MWTNGVENIHVHTEMAWSTLVRKKILYLIKVGVILVDGNMEAKFGRLKSSAAWIWTQLNLETSQGCTYRAPCNYYVLLLYSNHLVASLNWYLYVFSFSISDTPLPHLPKTHTHALTCTHFFFSLKERYRYLDDISLIALLPSMTLLEASTCD